MRDEQLQAQFETMKIMLLDEIATYVQHCDGKCDKCMFHDKELSAPDCISIKADVYIASVMK